jgi:hypothetical protein
MCTLVAADPDVHAAKTVSGDVGGEVSAEVSTQLVLGTAARAPTCHSGRHAPMMQHRYDIKPGAASAQG